MKTVNLSYVPRLYYVWGGGCDDDWLVEQFRGFDANDESAMKAALREYVLPDFLTYVPKARENARLALAYVLTLTDPKRPEFERKAKKVLKQLDLLDMFPALMIPFYPPDNIRNLLLWTWDVLFPNECFELPEVDAVSVINDSIQTTMRYRQ